MPVNFHVVTLMTKTPTKVMVTSYQLSYFAIKAKERRCMWLVPQARDL
jgi:hypothetical protein